jgi:hypothetical protein
MYNLHTHHLPTKQTLLTVPVYTGSWNLVWPERPNMRISCFFAPDYFTLFRSEARIITYFSFGWIGWFWRSERKINLKKKWIYQIDNLILIYASIFCLIVSIFLGSALPVYTTLKCLSVSYLDVWIRKHFTLTHISMRWFFVLWINLVWEVFACALVFFCPHPKSKVGGRGLHCSHKH